MRLLIWQWGRRGAGPRYAAEFAQALRDVPGVAPILSLSRQAELVQAGLAAPDLPVGTYDGLTGWGARMMAIPVLARPLARQLRALRVDAAFCAMPGPLDLLMAHALRLARVPFAVAVHDAELHPGDILPLQMRLQRILLRRADALVTFSPHVEATLQRQGRVRGRPVLATTLSPFAFGPPPPPPLAHGGPFRLLCFGRLLPYKGLDLLADALQLLGKRDQLQVRVVGAGPDSADLGRLRPFAAVENRWVPEGELAGLLAWADGVVLPYREASQSGVAAAAMAGGRFVLATRVGGLPDQLAHAPRARLCAVDAHDLARAIVELMREPPPSNAPTPDESGRGWRATAADLARQIGDAFGGG